MSNKFGAKKVEDPFTGEVFYSKREYKRWCQLRLLEKAGSRFFWLACIRRKLPMAGSAGKTVFEGNRIKYIHFSIEM